MSNLGRVYINTKPYLIELPSYRGRDLVDFSPRASTAGGSILHSELGLYQVIMQTDWRNGFGFPWWISEAGYQQSDGYLDTRHPGLVMLSSTPTVSESLDSSRFTNQFIFHKDSLYNAHNGGLRKLTTATGTWADCSPVASTMVNALWSNGTYIFAAVNGDYIYRATDGVAWTACGVNTNSKDYAWIGHHNGYVYAGKDGTNQVYFSDKVDLSDIAGDPADDPNTIFIGAGGSKTRGMVTFMGNAYIFTDTIMYKLQHELMTGIKTLDFTPEMDPNYPFRIGKWAVHNSMLMLAVKDTVYQWNGVRLADVTPNRINDSFPYDTYGTFAGMSTVGTELWCFGKRSVGGLGFNDLLVWDGVAWHQLATDMSITAAVHDRFVGYQVPAWDYFFFQVPSINPSTTSLVVRLQMTNRSKFFSGGFPTTGLHALKTSKIDAGFRRVTKSTPSILVEASNVTEPRYIRIRYSIDGGAFTEWGGTGNGHITVPGITELTDPLGTGNSTLEYKNIQFEIAFFTDSAAQSPILESLTVRLIMRPETNFGYAFNIVATSNPELGTQTMDNRSPAQIIADLHTARQSAAPITFVDPFGISKKVYIASLSEQAVEYHSDRPSPTPNIESRININLVEVG